MRLPERLAAFRANFEAGGPPYHAPAWGPRANASRDR